MKYRHEFDGPYLVTVGLFLLIFLFGVVGLITECLLAW